MDDIEIINDSDVISVSLIYTDEYGNGASISSWLTPNHNPELFLRMSKMTDAQLAEIFQEDTLWTDH